MAGADVVDLGLASTDLCYFAAGQPRRAGGDVHREPQPGRVQRHQAVPRRCGPDRRGDRARRDQGDARGRPARARRGPRSRRAPRSPPGVRRARALVRRRRCARADPRRHRHRQRRRWAHRARGLLAPPVRPHDALRRARRHVPEPSRRPDRGREPERPRPCGDRRRCRCRPRVRRRRRPRGARRRPGPAGVGLHHHRDPRRGDPRTDPGRRRGARSTGRAQPDLLEGRPRGDPRARWHADAQPRRATRSSSR